jgi:hypothetical protein
VTLVTVYMFVLRVRADRNNQLSVTTATFAGQGHPDHEGDACPHPFL